MRFKLRLVCPASQSALWGSFAGLAAKNISSRYSAAGIRRFAFVLPKDAPIPPMMNQSAPGESFLTRAFNSEDRAAIWLIETD